MTLATTSADAVWQRLGRAMTDLDTIGVLADLVEVLTATLHPVEVAGRAIDGRVPWEATLDPDTCPVEALPWLAQYVGVRLDDRLSEAAQRQQIKTRPYHRRGTVAAIKAAARPWLSSGDVTLIERDGGAYKLTVQYTAAQVDTPTLQDVADSYPTLADMQGKYLFDLAGDEPRMQQAVLAAKPAGLAITFSQV